MKFVEKNLYMVNVPLDGRKGMEGYSVQENVRINVKMIIGNGYTEGHAKLTLDLVKNAPLIKQLFEKKYT